MSQLHQNLLIPSAKPTTDCSSNININSNNGVPQNMLSHVPQNSNSHLQRTNFTGKLMRSTSDNSYELKNKKLKKNTLENIEAKQADKESQFYYYCTPPIMECHCNMHQKKELVEVIGYIIKDNEKLYYIHFIEHDKRYDEFVPSIALSECSGEVLPPTEQLKQKTSRPVTRSSLKKQKEKMGIAHYENEHDDNEEFDRCRVRNIQKIQFGKYLIDVWYGSPYPEDYSWLECLYVCPYCLKYMKYPKTYAEHLNDKTKTNCYYHPLGTEIYRDEKNNVSIFEVDGQPWNNHVYLQNLCLLSGLFLDHKSAFWDVEMFVFYIVTKHTPTGFEFIGYFSKEKNSKENNNLACIMTLPSYHQQGYGRFMISLSYELAKRTNLIGGPERPLSDLGKKSYSSYWIETILLYINNNFYLHPTIEQISQETFIATQDIIHSLDTTKLLQRNKGDFQVQYEGTQEKNSRIYK